MSNKIPLVNAPIGESGVTFTPDKFPQWVAYIASTLEGDSSGGGGGSNPLITGYGRIAGSDYFSTDLNAPRVPETPSLTVEIPNATYVVGARNVTVDEPGSFLSLSGVPPNMAGKYGYLTARAIEDSGGEFTLEILPSNWFDVLQPALSEAGLTCIGKVTSDADSVTAIDGTSADVIVPLSALRAQIKILGGAGKGEAAPTGEVSRTEFNLLKNGMETLQGQIADLEAKLASQSGASELFPQPFALLADEIAINRAGLAEVNPHAVERGQISVIVKSAGLGQSDTPNYSPTTGDPLELPIDIATGVGGP